MATFESAPSLGDDTLDGTAGPDTITDFDGHNLVHGNDGNDQLHVYGTVFGGAGDDSISGGLGPLSGEAGNDFINAFNPVNVGIISGGDGDDVVVLPTNTQALTIDGGAGFDTAVIFYEGGPLSVDQVGSVRLTGVEHTILYVPFDLDASGLGAGIEAINGTTALPLGFGSLGDNRLVGSAFADTLSGGEGADTISGGRGDDVLDGGDQGWGTYTQVRFTVGATTVVLPALYDLADYSAAPTGVTVDLNVKTAQDTGWGRDTLNHFEGVLGSAFNDVLIGAPGDTRVYGDDGQPDTPDRLGSRLDGAAGDDQLIGTTRDDTLTGGTGDDTLQGGAGNDLLDGGAGANRLAGGAGVDTFQLRLGATATITDFDHDLLALSDAGGQALSGAGGLLIWNQVAGQLLWDADGDAGPLAPVQVAGLAGSGPLTRDLLVPAFHPAVLRTITAAGVSDLPAPGRVITGGPGPDHIAATRDADTLSGGGGDDWLDGQGGDDVLTGGPGGDLFIFATDGSIDRATDFNPLTGDVIALFDNQGRLLSGAGGIIIWDQNTGALSWDPDSDAGPAPAVQVGILENAIQPLLRTSFAAGFAPSGVRTYTFFGDRTDLVFDRSGEAFDTGLATYTLAGALKSYVVQYDNGATSVTTVDVDNVQEWSRVTVDRDPFAVTAYSVTHDDGSRTLWQFDTNDSRPWTRVLEEYDALGRLSQQSGAYDDGTAFERHVDTYDTQPWAYSYDTFFRGALVSHTLYNADGSVFH